MHARRNRDLAKFVTTHLPSPPVRVLEVGCGSGALARALVEAGHHVTAIDPEAPDGPPFLRTALEDLEVGDPFDSVVAARSLHHLHDLPKSLDTIQRLLVPGGFFVVDDYAKERVDRPTADWYYERRQAIARAGGRAAPDSFDACLREWREDEEDIHTYAAMRADLDERFRERFFAWVPYLFLELGEAAPMEVEQSLIDAGAIRATGFRYVGETPRA
jgi:ubiquinone/menaquinone biosynthesis C-methylase UbiE